MRKRDQSLIHSFACALKGIGHAVRRERNLRIHIAAGAWLFWFSRYFDFTRGELALLALTVGLVMTAELLNTAVEEVVDIRSPEIREDARRAKDVAAGGVLAASAASILVGLFLFWDFDALQAAFQALLSAPFAAVGALVLTGSWVLLGLEKRR